jgi:serine/threonine protein phosphatase PrpC
MLCTKERKFQALKLTQHKTIVHSPLNSMELRRIYSNKGEVKTGLTLSGDKKPRVYVRGRMYPGLSTTRSLGDLLAHNIGVTSEPSIIIHKVTKE